MWKAGPKDSLEQLPCKMGEWKGNGKLGDVGNGRGGRGRIRIYELS
jgi:hypothetical protein